QLVIRGHPYVHLLDPETLQLTRRLDVKKDFASLTGFLTGLAPIQAVEWVLTTSNGPHVVNLQETRVVQTFGFQALPGSRLSLAREGFRFFVSNGENSTSRRVDFTNDGVNLTAFDEKP